MLASANQIKGKLFKVTLIVDVFTGETLNIGVVFIGKDGRVSNKLLDDYSGLKMMLDDPDIEEHGRYISETIKDFLPDLLLDDSETQSPLRNVIFGQRCYAAGISIDAILNHFFDENVTLARMAEKQLDAVDNLKRENAALAQKVKRLEALLETNQEFGMA